MSTVCLWRVEDNLWELVFCFCHVDPGIGPRAWCLVAHSLATESSPRTLCCFSEALETPCRF